MKSLQECSIDIKATNLRAVINSGSGEIIFRRTGNRIRRWMDDRLTGLSSEEDLRLMAKIMKIQGHKAWYNPNNKGNRSLVYTVLCWSNKKGSRLITAFTALPKAQAGSTSLEPF